MRRQRYNSRTETTCQHHHGDEHIQVRKLIPKSELGGSCLDGKLCVEDIGHPRLSLKTAATIS